MNLLAKVLRTTLAQLHADMSLFYFIVMRVLLQSFGAVFLKAMCSKFCYRLHLTLRLTARLNDLPGPSWCVTFICSIVVARSY